MIWTLSQPYGAPAWWPCKDIPDDKADSVFLNITVSNNLVVASNGLLMGITPQSGSRHTYHWEHHYPISTYLVSLAITDYAEFSNWYVSASGDSMELTYYVYPEQLAEAQEDFSVTPDMVAAFAVLFGEYPFINEKYGMASFPWGGAMEHQTMTSYGAGLITGTHQFDWLNAHELAHMWFGDCITMKYWSHIWMNEGFASYAEALWAESRGGWPAYHNYLLSQDPGFFQGSLWVEDSLNVGALFSGTVYDKGSWTLHMLRGVLGDAVFFDALHTYATDPDFYYGNARTEDFQAVCEAVSGTNLDWFFQEWVYRAGRPNYIYSWEASGGGASYRHTLQNAPANPSFRERFHGRFYGMGQFKFSDL
jgi:aminopeptidase N